MLVRNLLLIHLACLLLYCLVDTFIRNTPSSNSLRPSGPSLCSGDRHR